VVVDVVGAGESKAPPDAATTPVSTTVAINVAATLGPAPMRPTAMIDPLLGGGTVAAPR